MVPFGNGAERVLENRCTGAGLCNIDLNRHTTAHILRAAQEGIAYSFRYGIDIMRTLGLVPDVIRAGKANLFLSPLFCQPLGAALGAGFYKNRDEAFASLRRLETIEPEDNDREVLETGYRAWVQEVESKLKTK